VGFVCLLILLVPCIKTDNIPVYIILSGLVTCIYAFNCFMAPFPISAIPRVGRTPVFVYRLLIDSYVLWLSTVCDTVTNDPLQLQTAFGRGSVDRSRDPGDNPTSACSQARIL